MSDVTDFENTLNYEFKLVAPGAWWNSVSECRRYVTDYAGDRVSDTAADLIARHLYDFVRPLVFGLKSQYYESLDHLLATTDTPEAIDRDLAKMQSYLDDQFFYSLYEYDVDEFLDSEIEHENEGE